MRFPSLTAENTSPRVFEYMAEYAANLASHYMAQYRSMKRLYRATQEDVRIVHAVEAGRSRYAAIAASATLRHAILYRTKHEAKMAQERVANCGARFIVTSCAAETCESCDMPLWQHIVTMTARYCPGDGRPYWTLARAIITLDTHNACPNGQTGCTACRETIYQTLRPIAIENRSKTAIAPRR